MKPSDLIEEWLAKAQADLLAAETLSKRKRRQLPDQVGFFCQQCVEKMLKAFIQSRGLEPPKLHDLQELAEVAASLDSALSPISDWSRGLSEFAVQFRYPGASATAEDAKDALKKARKIYRYIYDELKG